MNFNSCFTLLPPADLAYLASWAAVMVQWVGAGAMVVAAAMFANVLALSAPAFALAIGGAVFSGAARAHCQLIWTHQTDLFKQTKCLDKCRVIPSNDPVALYPKDFCV